MPVKHKAQSSCRDQLGPTAAGAAAAAQQPSSPVAQQPSSPASWALRALQAPGFPGPGTAAAAVATLQPPDTLDPQAPAAAAIGASPESGHAAERQCARAAMTLKRKSCANIAPLPLLRSEMGSIQERWTSPPPCAWSGGCQGQRQLTQPCQRLQSMHLHNCSQVAMPFVHVEMTTRINDDMH